MSPRTILDRFAHLSTGLKMVIVLGLALLPLGGIALFASLETSRTAREQRMSETGLVAETARRRVVNSINLVSATLRSAADAGELAGEEAGACAAILDSLVEGFVMEVRMALFRPDDTPLCATSGYDPPAPAHFTGPNRTRAVLDPGGTTVRFFAVSRNREVIGVAELAPDALASLVRELHAIADYRMSLTQGANSYVVHDWAGESVPESVNALRAPVAGGRIILDIEYEYATLRFVERLAIMLPVLMLVAAALLGWLLVSLMLLRPLARLERAVADFGGQGGDPAALELPVSRTPATEIHSLGRTFRRTAETMTGNQRELEAGIAEQMRLTREVHHRVKNNLQIVASLLSLHARSAPSGEIAEAYASIQRRVDALAIVQRNLLAGQEEGAISVRSVLAELASGLQQSAPPGTRLTISLDIADANISQDIAVPVAFIVTEIVEMAMLAGARSGIAIELGEADPETGRARLEIRSAALADEGGTIERYERVLTGLARQLREPLERGPGGAYSIQIPVLETALD